MVLLRQLCYAIKTQLKACKMWAFYAFRRSLWRQQLLRPDLGSLVDQSVVILPSDITVNFYLAVSRGEIRSEESQVIFDSSYFKNIDGVEASIEKDSRLQDIDLRVKEEYLETLTKFYQVRSTNVQLGLLI